MLQDLFTVIRYMKIVHILPGINITPSCLKNDFEIKLIKEKSDMSNFDDYHTYNIEMYK